MPLMCVITLCLVLHDIGLCIAYDRAAIPAARSSCLVQLTLRGGPVVVSFLTRKHEGFVAAQRAGGNRDQSTVELLTALRRAQGQTDPVPVVVSLQGEGESIFPKLPTIDAALVNRDVQKTPVTFKNGGDYRSGRQARWRLDVHDAKGDVMPVKLPRGIYTGGGLYRMGVLKHEESWETVLPMRKFIDLPPGDYTVVVEYHDEETIADREDTKGLIVCRSKPFKLHVQPRVIDVTKADRKAAKEAIAAFPDKGPVQIVVGRYDKGAKEFIRPDSAAGRLLTLGWRAVPTLLDALDDKTATDQQRAWVFATLYGITGWNDPRDESGVLAEYDGHEGGWAVVGGRSGRTLAMGLGFGGGGSMRGGKFDREAQQAFAKEWKAVREYIVVRERP